MTSTRVYNDDMLLFLSWHLYSTVCIPLSLAGLNSHNSNIQMQPTLIEKIWGNLNFNEYLLVGKSESHTYSISLKCQRYIMTFSSPHHQIFIEHFNFRRFFSNSTEILYPLQYIDFLYTPCQNPGTLLEL